jgi:hypothetical protein
MTVHDLIKTLPALPLEATVFVTFSGEEERPAQSVTFDGRLLRIIDRPDDAQRGEALLYTDPTP